MTIDLGTELAQAMLGMDRLYRGGETGDGILDREGLVAFPPAQPEPASYADWQAADAALAALESRLPEIDEPLRRDFVAEMLFSLRAAVAGFGGTRLSYAETVECCLRTPARGASPQDMQGYRVTIGDCLKELGFDKGRLGERVTQWETTNRVPPADVPDVLNELLREGAKRTAERVLPLPTADLAMTAVGLHDQPFSAYCDSPHRQLKVNLDYVYTRAALKHLACHEAFPGHLLHITLREQRTQAGLMPADAPLVMVNSASSAIFEGIGENGIYFLDWVDGPEDRLAMALNRLRSAARCNAALMIHRDGAPLDYARAYLTETCYAGPAWVESRLAFLTHKLRAPFIFAYWCGDMAVDRVWQTVQPDQRPAFFRYLYHNMHTPTTLYAHWAEYASGESAS
jgi:hypothetical protein